MHTQGAWTAVTEDDPRGQPQAMYRGLVCLVAHGDKRLSVVTDGRDCLPSEWRDNAKLMAVAPELLEALVVLENAARDPINPKMLEVARADARATIAKART